MWISLIIRAVIVVLLLIFIVQNNVAAQFQYFGWQFELPLGVAMLFAAIGGILIAGLIGSVRIFVLNRRLKKIQDRKSTRLNSSHVAISYAVFCLKKKKRNYAQ